MPVPILVLAAGESTRMGNRVKQLLPWKDITLLENAVQQAKNVTDDVYVVLGSNMEMIRKSVSVPFEMIYNPDWKSGMGGSISIGVKHILAKSKILDGLLIMLADQPLIDADYLRELQEEFKKETHNIVATSYDNTLGVPAVFHHSMLSELSSLNNKDGAKQVIQKHKSFAKEIFPKGKEADIDTYQEYLQLIDNMNT